MTQKRKLVKIIVTIFVICLIGGLASVSLERLRVKEKSKEVLAHFPLSNLTDIETGSFLNLDNYNDKPILLVFFNSECSLCHEETTILVNKMNQLSDKVVVFASAQSLVDILSFRNQYELTSRINVKVCQVQDSEGTLFSSGAVPQIFIYNLDRDLVRSFQGKTKVEALIKAAQYL